MSQEFRVIHPEFRRKFPDVWKGFDLNGMYLGESFSGCESCGVMLKSGELKMPDCPVCKKGMHTYTVTQQDLDATPK